MLMIALLLWGWGGLDKINERYLVDVGLEFELKDCRDVQPSTKLKTHNPSTRGSWLPRPLDLKIRSPI